MLGLRYKSVNSRAGKHVPYRDSKLTRMLQVSSLPITFIFVC